MIVRRRASHLSLAVLAVVTLLVGLVATTAGPAAGQAPRMVGHLDSITVDKGMVRVVGWAHSSGGYEAFVDLYVDGSMAHRSPTDDARPDVQRAFPGFPLDTGFDKSFPIASGAHQVCAYVHNSFGQVALLGCRTVTNPGAAAVIGHFDALEIVDGAVRATGWAVDPTDPQREVEVHLWVKGAPNFTSVFSTPTGTARPDVAAVFPAYPGDAGFSWSWALDPRTYEVCAYAIDIVNLNQPLGCRTVTVGAA